MKGTANEYSLELLDRKRLTVSERRSNLRAMPGSRHSRHRESVRGRTPEGSLFFCAKLAETIEEIILVQ